MGMPARGRGGGLLGHTVWGVGLLCKIAFIKSCVCACVRALACPREHGCA